MALTPAVTQFLDSLTPLNHRVFSCMHSEEMRTICYCFQKLVWPTELGEFYRNDGTAIPEFGDGLDYGCYDVGVGKTSIIRNDIATEKKLVDDPNDKYQQIQRPQKLILLHR